MIAASSCLVLFCIHQMNCVDSAMTLLWWQSH